MENCRPLETKELKLKSHELTNCLGKSSLVFGQKQKLCFIKKTNDLLKLAKIEALRMIFSTLHRFTILFVAKYESIIMK